jgi:uncharacterized small protein (DUF1192 family)
MSFDDLEPQKKKPVLKNLEELSIEALHEYIAEMETEIDRVREAIKTKEAARQGAEAFFKK